MKRKMVAIGISYILGLFFASFLSQERFWIAAAVGTIVFMLLLLTKAFTPKVLLVSAVFFFTGALQYAGYTVNTYIPITSLAGEKSSFYGKISSSEVYDGDYASYIAEGTFSDGTEASVLCFTENYNCRYGDYIKISGTFSVPDKTYLYDGKEYYKGQSVFLEADSDCEYAVIYVDECQIIRKIAEYRDRIQRRIYSLSGRTGGSLTAAMLFGDKSALDESVESSFYHTGLGPMLSVSGFHLVIFSGICNVIGRRTRMQRILQFLITAVLTVLFTLVSMWPISVLRAGVMLLVSRGACLFFRSSDSLSSLCLTVVIMTCVQPYLIHNVGFLLSVAGTFGVSSFAPWIMYKLPLCGWSGGIIRTSFSAALVTLCTLPICICCFSETSLLAPISNVIFAPMCVVIMFCGIIIFFFGGAGGISHVCGYIIDIISTLLVDWMRWIELNMPVSYPCGWNSLHAAACILSAMVIVIYLISRSRKFVCVACAFSVFIMAAGQYICKNQFRDSLRIFILGRKDEQVIAVSYNGRTDAVDITGDRKNGDYLFSFLEKYGISSLQSLYIGNNVNAAAVVYNDLLYSYDVECVMSSTESEFSNEMRICSQPLIITDHYRIESPDYTISIEDDNFLIEAYGRLIFISPDEPYDNVQTSCDYGVFTINRQKAVFDMSGEGGEDVISYGNNMEIIIHADGSVEVRRLD